MIILNQGTSHTVWPVAKKSLELWKTGVAAQIG